MLGLRSLRRLSTWWLAAAMVASLLAFGAHSLQGSVLFVVAGAWMLAWWGQRRRGATVGETAGRARKGASGLVVLAVAIVIVGTTALVYVHLLARSWNHGWTGYSPAHLTIAMVGSVGWPVVLLALIGLCAIAVRDRTYLPFWGLALGALATTGLILPRWIVFRHAYLYPLEVVLVLLAGFGVGLIYDAVRQTNRPAARRAGCARSSSADHRICGWRCTGGGVDLRPSGPRVLPTWGVTWCFGRWRSATTTMTFRSMCSNASRRRNGRCGLGLCLRMLLYWSARIR